MNDELGGPVGRARRVAGEAFVLSAVRELDTSKDDCRREVLLRLNEEMLERCGRRGRLSLFTGERVEKGWRGCQEAGRR